MKISLNWLKDYIDTDLNAEQTAETLSDLGFPCEGIEKLADDTVIDVEVTSNRGDCLGYIGIARELAAATGRELKIPSVELAESDREVTELAEVQIDEPSLCGRYTARVIEGVKVGPSPDWMKRRLETVGLRSVNNVVDATNYAMLETGQPPHAFDYHKINQGRIIVRKANEGERLVSIDGSKCDLNNDMLIIADPRGPVAIAGVMGGLDTEVGDATTTILLEDAYFDPVCVRSTSRRLSLPSDASYRFERIVDIGQVDWASKRTAQLIIQVSGGKAAKGLIDVFPGGLAEKEVTLRLARLKQLLGIEISSEEAFRILSALCFLPVSNNGSIVCKVPSWRSDVYREADLIEEVARLHGYNKIPTERTIKIEVTPVDSRQKLAESVARSLNSCGFYETINVSFIDNSIAPYFTTDSDREHLAVKDVSRKSANILRRTLIGSLLEVLKTNINARNLDCRIYEISNTFVPRVEQESLLFTELKDSLPIEKTKLALVCDGDFRELTGAIKVLIKNISHDADIVFSPSDVVWAQAGAEIILNSQTIGAAGIVSEAIREKYDFKEINPCAAEIDFESLMKLQRGTIQVKPIPRYPAILRDLSIIVDESVLWSDISRAVRKAAPAELEEIRFVEIYRGKGIPEGKKSIMLSLKFRDEDGTLTHERVDDFQHDIVSSLSGSVGAVLRDSK